MYSQWVLSFFRLGSGICGVCATSAIERPLKIGCLCTFLSKQRKPDHNKLPGELLPLNVGSRDFSHSLNVLNANNADDRIGIQFI